MVSPRKPPDGEEKPRLKLLVFGATGVGKTTSSIWPNSVLIDGERGSVHYQKLLDKRKCIAYDTTDVEEACKIVTELMTSKHQYRTLVVDPITAFYEDSQNKWNDRYAEFYASKGDTKQADMQDYGPAYWAKVKREQKHFLTLLKRIDMNVIVTAHEKAEYAKGGGVALKVIGQTYDGIKGLDYTFDTVLRLQHVGPKRIATALKDRTGKFPEQFEYSYDTILERWGEALEREAEVVTPATSEQVELVRNLVGAVKVRDGWESDVKRKAEVSDWDEMDSGTIDKCINYLKKHIPTQKDAK